MESEEYGCDDKAGAFSYQRDQNAGNKWINIHRGTSFPLRCDIIKSDLANTGRAA